MDQVVDLDEPDSWPDAFRELAESAASRANADAWFYGRDEVEAVAALEGRRVRAYHCTRLTAREVQSVRANGLVLLSAELAQERLDGAVEDGYLSVEEAAIYRRTVLPRDTSRAGKVWFFTDCATLADAHEIGYLVEVWGGEEINMELESHSPEMERLERVGTPSVVIVSLDLRIHRDYAHPGVLTAAVRRLLSGNGGTSIQSTVAVEPEYIDLIEQPGGAFWDDYVWTPREGFKYS